MENDKNDKHIASLQKVIWKEINSKIDMVDYGSCNNGLSNCATEKHIMKFQLILLLLHMLYIICNNIRPEGGSTERSHQIHD